MRVDVTAELLALNTVVVTPSIILMRKLGLCHHHECQQSESQSQFPNSQEKKLTNSQLVITTTQTLANRNIIDRVRGTQPHTDRIAGVTIALMVLAAGPLIDDAHTATHADLVKADTGLDAEGVRGRLAGDALVLGAHGVLSHLSVQVSLGLGLFGQLGVRAFDGEAAGAGLSAVEG